jgi:anaerobic ribonucleoside-triphosphate reductase
MVTIKKNEKKLVKVIECEVYTRVVGYYRPVNNFNAGKRHEFENRHLMEVKDEN